MASDKEGTAIPFREHPIPTVAYRWALPAYVALSLIAVVTWVVWIVVLLQSPQPVPRPGQGGVSPTAALFIAGIAGLGALSVLGIAVAIVLFETTAYETRLFISGLLARQHVQPTSKDEES